MTTKWLQSANKVTPFSKTLALAIFILFPFLGFFLGKFYGISIGLSRSEWVITNLEQMVAEKEKEIQLCFQDSAEITDSLRTPYSIKTEGIYSSLLQGKTVENTQYTYKRNIITEKRIKLKENILGSSSLGITFWQFTKLQDKSALSPGFVIFGGYENYANHPLLLSTIQEAWDAKYTSKNGTVWYYSYGYAPKGGIIVLYLDMYQKNTPYGYPQLVRVWIDNLNMVDEDDISIKMAKEELQQLVDTIDFRSPK